MKYWFSDGQKIAKKLSIQISKETKGIMKLLQQYNACHDIESSLAINEALDPSLISIKLQKYGTSGHMIADGKKRDVIDAYLMYTRCQEEIQLLMDEAKNVVEYYDRKRNILINLIQSKDDSSQHARGTKALLHQMLTQVDLCLSKSRRTKDVIVKNYDSHSWLHNMPIDDIDDTDDSDDDSVLDFD